MPHSTIEHANLTVTDAKATAAWMNRVFGWKVRWEGPSIDNGWTMHVGDADRYVALYAPSKPTSAGPSSYTTVGGLNHIGVVTAHLTETEAAVRAEGFEPHSHADYEPGKRFYFDDADGIEYEVVSYSDR